MAVGGAGYYFSLNSCSQLLACRDSETVVSLEERELLRDAKAGLVRNGDVAYPFYPQGPEPLEVQISGKNATLRVAGPVDQNWLYYAQVWSEVYSKYHGGRNAVSLHIVWKSGDVYQVFPTIKSF
jgi:hypothetical protein